MVIEGTALWLLVVWYFVTASVVGLNTLKWSLEEITDFIPAMFVSIVGFLLWPAVILWVSCYYLINPE